MARFVRLYLAEKACRKKGALIQVEKFRILSAYLQKLPRITSLKRQVAIGCPAIRRVLNYATLDLRAWDLKQNMKHEIVPTLSDAEASPVSK